jgi:hypothetical protein
MFDSQERGMNLTIAVLEQCTERVVVNLKDAGT